jgi:uncharacterized RDD family membrane protein YckC
MELFEMKCPHCGANVSDADTFCYQCGGSLESAEATATKPPVSEVKATPAPKTIRTGVDTFRFAGFWKRFAAWLLDFIILTIITIPLSVTPFFVPYPLSSFISTPISLLIGVLYYGLQESSAHQATLGKRALGIIVTDLEGSRISFGRAAGRELAKILSALILFIGFLMIGFTEKKQGLHDMIAECLVIDR